MNLPPVRSGRTVIPRGPIAAPGPVQGEWRVPAAEVPPPKKKSHLSLVGAVVAALLFGSLVATCGVRLVMPMIELPGMLEEALRACEGPSTREACFDAMNLPDDLRGEFEHVFVLSTPEGFQEISTTETCVLNNVADVRGTAYFAQGNLPIAGAFRRINGEWVLLSFGPASEIPRGCGDE